MIKLRGVNKYFNKGKKNEIHVINETTVDLGQKGLVALLGPSGSGKTTMLNAVGGLDKVNKGDIFVDGKKITGRSASKADSIRTLNIGYIFQDYKLVDNMTVYENVAMALKMIGIKDEAEIKKRSDYVLETLNIYRYRNRLAGMLSGGERQRVGIARAIAKNPKIIIADEPTGNLDSANTIEIMNIIKSISRDRLVVLVTHEVELAKFYASRIIELKDGKIVKDYQNETDDNLNYRIDNKFYLKDFEKQQSVAGGSVNVNFYGSNQDKLDIDVVVKNGNIYIKTRNDERIEVIDNNSAIEFVDDHFKEMDKSLYEEYKFDFDEVVDSTIKEKYSSIIGFFPSLARGFKKIADYTLMKKLLFIGFILAGVFITYAFSSIYANLDVKDKDFISNNRDYLTVDVPKVEVEKYLEYAKLPEVDYVFPDGASAAMNFDMNFYYQTGWAQSMVRGALTDAGKLTSEDLIYGRLPENPYEVVLDKLSVQRMFDSGTAKQVGITEFEQMLGKTLKVPNMKEFTIVGITDKMQPVIYTDPSMFTDIIYNKANDEWDTGEGTKDVLNYQTCAFEYTLKKGRLPENDYETIVPYARSEEFKLNKETDKKINDKKLKVVGYYESPEEMNTMLVNMNTIKYALINKASRLDVAPAAGSKDAVIATLQQSHNLNVKDAYQSDREKYIKDRADMTKSAIILGIIILAISLIEILLMIRSSFLSRIKEIGIYRAIGVKKTDIYKMFLGEIVAITTVSSFVGIILMSYVLAKLCQIEAVTTYLAMNPVVFFGAIIVVYLFNSIVGLIPVFNTMRKTPAQILARYDVD